jgi:hypothetical protein
VQDSLGNRITLYGDFHAKVDFNLQREDANQLGKAVKRILEENPELPIAFPPRPTIIRITGERVYEATLDGAISCDHQAGLIILHVHCEFDSDHLPVNIKHLPPGPILRRHGTPVSLKFRLQHVNVTRSDQEPA